MLKFIATDLDGTLLDGNQSLPEETFPMIHALHEKGVLFAPASGRQYANLKKLFAPVADDLLFIAENGALIRYRGETLLVRSIPYELIFPAIENIRKTEGCFPVLCCADTAYIEDDAEPFYSTVTAAYTSCVLLDRLEDAIGKEPLCKIAVFDEFSSEHTVENIKSTGELKLIPSGRHWCDISTPAWGKGHAMRFIREKFSLKKEECAAFGDHMNDYDMLLECGMPFVTENAYPPLKEAIGNIVPSNAEGGVITKIKELLLS